jgi:hypothetical protein
MRVPSEYTCDCDEPGEGKARRCFALRQSSPMTWRLHAKECACVCHDAPMVYAEEPPAPRKPTRVEVALSIIALVVAVCWLLSCSGSSPTESALVAAVQSAKATTTVATSHGSILIEDGLDAETVAKRFARGIDCAATRTHSDTLASQVRNLDLSGWTIRVAQPLYTDHTDAFNRTSYVSPGVGSEVHEAQHVAVRVTHPWLPSDDWCGIHQDHQPGDEPHDGKPPGADMDCEVQTGPRVCR